MIWNMKLAKKAILMLACVAILTLSGVVGAFAEEAPDKSEQAMAVTSSLTEAIVLLSDEEIAEFEDSDDKFTVSLVDAWKNSKEELGAWLGDADPLLGTETVEEKAGKYTVTVPRTFELHNADFIYILDRKLNPTSVTIDVKLSMGTTFVRAILNTLIGICTVFLVLVFLSFVISLLGKVPALVEGKKKGAESVAPKAASAPVRSAAPAPVAESVSYEEETDDLALVAVITAAIEAYTGQSSDTFVVRSIRKAVRRSR